MISAWVLAQSGARARAVQGIDKSPILRPFDTKDELILKNPLTEFAKPFHGSLSH
jgi:hypothetical protein